MNGRGRGSVALVGAGPGDPGLLTVSALECIRGAEVVLCDRLVSDAVRALIPATTRIVEVGKARGTGANQAAIIRILLREARAGRRVVRLKGGDPYVFGRGGEEAIALRDAGIGVEVVPGVSAAIAGPAAAGIPVTHRGLASSVCILTAEEAQGARTDWRAAAAADTVVLLMGVSGLDAAARALIDAGKDSKTPAAIVQDATLPTQRVVRATLATLASRAQRAGLAPPATVIVGATAALDLPARTRRDARSLEGRRILVTRAGHQAQALADKLRDAGGEPVLAPAITIKGGPAAAMRAALDALSGGEIDWVVFTSANGVDAVFDRIAERELDARIFGDVSVAAIGPATAQRLADHGLRCDLVATPATSKALAKAFPKGAGSVLLPRADQADAGLGDAIARKGWMPWEVVAYRIVDAPRWSRPIADAIRDGRIDLVTFASAGTAAATARQLRAARIDPAMLKAVCIGPVCAQGARDAGFDVIGVAADPLLDSLVAASVASLRSRRARGPGSAPPSPSRAPSPRPRRAR